MIDPRDDSLTLTEYVLRGDAYRVATETDGLFVTDQPWKVSVDLPALLAEAREHFGDLPD
ncbi:hypothetical protein J2S43_005671 [Catenuloplanes nepalensis]|uniref:Uncharacterized protein n=1 Tax=Catenuloplanes nepalensis TaxID=587533 RepID=A0ABT9N0E7_9ACTN|nr:hypothetical protein [Catenuloplanes nepalensis]